MKSMKSQKTIIAIVAFLIVCIGAGILIFNANSDSSSDGPSAQPVAALPAADTKYKDGTYAATGSYDSPAGMENVAVSVTVKDNVVTAATVTNEAQDRESKHYQDLFISGYQSQVVGKSLASLHLGKVSGSSLTGNGFNDAIAKIQAQAKV